MNTATARIPSFNPSPVHAQARQESGQDNPVDALRMMLDDHDWSLPVATRQFALQLLSEFRRRDAALLLEPKWQEFEGEVRDYLHFRRFCLDSAVRGSAGERRSAWESECLAEANALIHRQQVRERGYSRPPPLSQPFRIC